MTGTLRRLLRTGSSHRWSHAMGVRPAAILGVMWVVLLAAGCASPPPAAPAAPAPLGLADVLDRPSERALFDGLRAYDDGQYDQAETALRAALAGTLRSPRDKATAHKLLAFIYCTSNREVPCEAAFRSARETDATFRLSRAEAGHPLWGPVYRRVARSP